MATGNTQAAEQDHFDLLPFIAIMMCLLGTLLLVTMSMAAINIGAGAGEGWVPEHDPGAKVPVLIEWDGRYAIWHSEKGLQKIEDDFVEYANFGRGWIRYDAGGLPARVAGPQPNAMDPLIDYLESHRQSYYALFAVRPGGFANFRRFASRFENHKIEIGSEPIDQGKPVRLIMPKGSPK
jgi:biopolymer transport protein ExbD